MLFLLFVKYNTCIFLVLAHIRLVAVLKSQLSFDNLATDCYIAG